ASLRKPGSRRALIESVELAELVQLRARRAEVVGLVLSVAVADRHAAEQHLVLRQFQEIAGGAVEPRPGLLRTGVEPIAAGEKRQRVDVAAEIGPLAGAEPAVDGDEQRHRRVEELKVLLELREPRDRAGAGDAE